MSNSAIKPALTNFPESRRILLIWIISPSSAGTDTRASWRKCDWKCALVAFLHAAPPAARSWLALLPRGSHYHTAAGVWFHSREPRGAQRGRPRALPKGGLGYGAICLRLPALFLPNQADITAPRTPTRSPSSHFKSSGAAAPTGGYKPDQQRSLNKCLLMSAHALTMFCTLFGHKNVKLFSFLSVLYLIFTHNLVLKALLVCLKLFSLLDNNVCLFWHDLYLRCVLVFPLI